MALSSLSDLLTRMTGGSSGAPELIHVWKDRRVAGAAATAPVANKPISLWQYSGSRGEGSAPGAVAAPTNSTDGSVKQTDAAGGLTKYLVAMAAAASFGSGTGNFGTLILYDRLLHISGLSGTNTGAQTVGGSLTRNTGGVGNQIWVEIYSALGATATTITASYTNQAGTSSRTTRAVTIGGTGRNEAQRMIMLPLQAGDYGVQAVASVTLAASTLTAGDFGVNVAHPLAFLPLPLNGPSAMRNFAAGLPNLVTIEAGACLAFVWLNGSGAQVPSLNIELAMVSA